MKQLESYDGLEQLARTAICSFAHSNTVDSLLRSEEAIGTIIGYILTAKEQWEEGKGMTLSSYVLEYAKYGVRHYVSRVMPKENQHISLDVRGNDFLGVVSIANREEEESPLEQLILEENGGPAARVCQMFEKVNFSSTQKKCMTLVYCEDLTPSEAARRLGVSRQLVDQTVKACLAKLRKVYDSERFSER
jgi:RNA polymerase sigma factor (sigma-70 family)